MPQLGHKPHQKRYNAHPFKAGGDDGQLWSLWRGGIGGAPSGGYPLPWMLPSASLPHDPQRASGRTLPGLAIAIPKPAGYRRLPGPSRKQAHFFYPKNQKATPTMMSRTHAVFGAACWAAACVYFHFPLQVTGLLVAAAASFLPDIDHPQSTLGRHVKFISLPLSHFWGHRGVTHSAAAVAAIILVLHHYHLSGQKWIWPIAVGYSSHILGDFVTRSGIAFFWPLKLRISIGLWRTDGAVEVVVRNCLILLLCWFSFRAWM